jgi:hypothetical protein
MRKETELLKISQMDDVHYARHQAYVRKRNRLYWENFRREQLDEIAWNNCCNYREAKNIYNFEMRALAECNRT